MINIKTVSLVYKEAALVIEYDNQSQKRLSFTELQSLFSEKEAPSNMVWPGKDKLILSFGNKSYTLNLSR